MLGNVASPVRREAVGKGPHMRDLAGGPPNDDLGDVIERVLDRHRSALRELTLPSMLTTVGATQDQLADRELHLAQVSAASVASSGDRLSSVHCAWTATRGCRC